MKSIVNRLKRLEGQIGKVREELESGTGVCNNLVAQFLATKGALDATIKEYLILSLKDCAGKRSEEETQLLVETIIKKL